MLISLLLSICTSVHGPRTKTVYRTYTTQAPQFVWRIPIPQRRQWRLLRQGKEGIEVGGEEPELSLFSLSSIIFLSSPSHSIPLRGRLGESYRISLLHRDRWRHRRLKEEEGGKRNKQLSPLPNRVYRMYTQNCSSRERGLDGLA